MHPQIPVIAKPVRTLVVAIRIPHPPVIASAESAWQSVIPKRERIPTSGIRPPRNDTENRNQPNIHVIASAESAWQSVTPNKLSMYYVYILTDRFNRTVYTGITKDLIRRVYEHKNNCDPNSFTAKYSVHKLVYFEETSDVRSAIEREKQIKSWNRKRKNQLIEAFNPTWQELYDDFLG